MISVSLDQALQLATEHLTENESSGKPSLVLIDGRAGSGKSFFAQALKNQFFAETKSSPRLIAMDDLYPGWEGLGAGSVYLLEKILLPLSKGIGPSWQNWDWEQGKRGGSDAGNGMRSLEPGVPLVVEGCGALSRDTKPLGTMSIWLESELDTRRARFSQRDSGRFDEYFGIWSAQEDEFYAEHRSAELADIKILN